LRSLCNAKEGIGGSEKEEKATGKKKIKNKIRAKTLSHLPFLLSL